MITVVCVKAGTKYSPDYVNILHDSVRRHLSVPHEFLCATDNPSGVQCPTVDLGEPQLRGWWHKLQLFRPLPHPWGIIDRVLFLDLDVVIVGSLNSIALHRPDCDFLMCRDFIYPHETGNSSVMLLTVGSRPEVWRQFSLARDGWIKTFHGDQEFICGLWPGVETLPEEWVVSYRLQSRTKVPGDARIVAFHGLPKPANVRAGWVPEFWRTHQDQSTPVLCGAD